MTAARIITYQACDELLLFLIVGACLIKILFQEVSIRKAYDKGFESGYNLGLEDAKKQKTEGGKNVQS